MEVFGKRFNKLILLSVVLSGSIFLSACAPVYRFIKGKDPDHVLGSPTLSVTHKNYLTDNQSNILKVTLNQMVPGDDSRLPGTSGEKETTDYISSILQANGYEAMVQYFPVKYTMTKKVNLVDVKTDGVVESVLIARTGLSPREDEFTVLNVGGGLREDFEYLDLTDKLILVEKKFRNLDEICKDIEEFGGAGIIYYSDVETSLPRDNVSQSYDFPVFSVTFKDAEKIVKRLDDEEEAVLKVTRGEAEFTSESQNVYGFLGKFDPDKKTVLLTANMDSTMSPGTNFNASGVATLLLTAEVAGRNPIPDYNLMYAFFGASTLDNEGEKNFLRTLNKNVSDSLILRIGLDSVGHGNTLYLHGNDNEAMDSQVKLAKSISGQLGYSFEQTDVNSKVSEIFEASGIKSLEMRLGPDSNAGTKLDTIDKVDIENLKNMANIVLNLIYDLKK